MLIISGRIFPIVNDLFGMDFTVFPYTATIEAYKLSLEGIGFITTLLNTVEELAILLENILSFGMISPKVPSSNNFIVSGTEEESVPIQTATTESSLELLNDLDALMLK